jgi:hypothetical protein
LTFSPGGVAPRYEARLSKGHKEVGPLKDGTIGSIWAPMSILANLSPRTQAALAELVAAIEAETRANIQRLIGGELAAPAKRRGRPPKAASTSTALTTIPRAQAVVTPTKPRKKPPRQLCPVPGCKNTAAPIFGMVCKDHKDVAKSKITKYREERRKAQERRRA